jgi:WhiB family transcriptional regulator, redox-sensing transcriptional regulator
MEHKLAKQVCRGCPVRTECLVYAMETPVDHGVWGGLTERERRRLRRRAADGGWRELIA